MRRARSTPPHGQAARHGRILLRFAHPEPPRPAARALVLPVFLPYAGCPQRCVFCNQPAQTGQAPEPLEALHERLQAQLAALALAAPHALPQELAFYGGTFTALPAPWPQRFLRLCQPLLASGRLSRVRCSTRPDAVAPAQLAELRGLGLSLVELGVQSFDDASLAASQRGYGGATARRACRAVREAGLALGVQLMPGLPGQSLEVFRADIALTAGLKPELARLYPCLVLEGTPLAQEWRDGAFAPWSLEAALEALAPALLELWAAGVAVARVGLAGQPGLDVLAGPRHPALGQLARSRALVLHVGRRLAQASESAAPGPASPGPAAILLLPRRLQGEALGQRNALAADYAGLGLRVALWDEADLALTAAD